MMGPFNATCSTGNCGPDVSLTQSCQGDSILLQAIISDQSYVDSTATIFWSTGVVAAAELIEVNGQMYLGGKMLVYEEDDYDIDLTTGGGCYSNAFLHAYDCSEDCGHLITYSYECILAPQNVEVTISAVAWDISNPPATPFQYIWSTGDTTYASSQNGFYISQLTKPGLSGSISITITDDVGCVSIDTFDVNCLWPGDTDLNGGVNHYDLLNIGLGYDKMGATCAAATLVFTC